VEPGFGFRQVFRAQQIVRERLAAEVEDERAAGAAAGTAVEGKFVAHCVRAVFCRASLMRFKFTLQLAEAIR
jgi:hypothetical protein